MKHLETTFPDDFHDLRSAIGPAGDKVVGESPSGTSGSVNLRNFGFKSGEFKKMLLEKGQTSICTLILVSFL